MATGGSLEGWKRVRADRPRPRGARGVRQDVEGKAGALVARNERARRVRRGRHPRWRDEPRGVGRWRRIDGRPLRPRVSGADVIIWDGLKAVPYRRSANKPSRLQT